MRWLALILILVGLVPAMARAESERGAGQEPALRRIEARITSISGDSVYFDKGRDVRIEPGDIVHVLPTGGTRIIAAVTSISRSGSRAIVADTGDLRIGDRVEILVPESRFAEPVPAPTPQVGTTAGQTPVRPEPVGAEPVGAEAVGAEPSQPTAGQAAAEGQEAPEHPPWTHPPEEWAEETPLLAPPEATSPADRDRKLSGRVYFGLDHTWDDANETRRYLLGRTGLDALAENPFGQGGGLRFRGEVFHRVSSRESTGDEELTEFRLDRFSYFVGGTRESSSRIEVGRFLQDAFPEFQIIDGAEYQYRTDGGNRWGASAGVMPVPDAVFSIDGDTQLAAFFRSDGDEDAALDWGLGFQKTWHEGEADRDLLVGDFNWSPTDRAWVHGTAWVDFYDSSDQIKSGVELTELRLGGNWRIGEDSGVHADLARILWPDIKRYEFPPLPPPETAASEVTRFNVGGWSGLTDRIRLRGRLDWWQDEVQDGVGGELTMAWRELLWQRGEVNATLFKNGGAFSSVTGARFGGTMSSSKGFLSGSWELGNHEMEDFAGTQKELLQQVLRLSWDVTFGDDWDLSLSADQRFGDEQDAFSLGFFLQRRF